MTTAPPVTAPSTPSATGQLVVLTGPSGVGKGTLLKRLRQRHPNLYLSISATTRPPRSGEVDGQQYYFLDRAAFEAMVAAGDLLEWAEYAGNYYGTPRHPVEQQIQAGQTVILEIELEGARQVAQTFPTAQRIFIAPPDPQALEHRLRQRGQDDDATIRRRLERAQAELAAIAEFDQQIINDDLETAVGALETAIFGPVPSPPAETAPQD
ncbi:MAG: guanylate kinase [Leptolyngbya sp. RL_3_1]|nr:guanylate kinase [Leptolyngbya sp. RL_3_1]